MMVFRPKGSDPQRMSVTLQGRPGEWRSSLPGAVRPAPPSSPLTGRPNDGKPNPQAFSIPLIQAYPKRITVDGRDHRRLLHSCARGCCAKLTRSHAALANAIADGVCPLGKFNEEL